MKVLVLNYEYPPLGGGAANATKYILGEFSKYNNLEVHLVTSSTGESRVERISKNVTIHFLDIGKNGELHNQSNKDLLTYSWKAYNYSKKLNKTKKFDLIHAFFGIPCGFMAKKLKIPYLVSLRGSDVPFYSEKYEKLDKLFFKRMSIDIWKKAKFVVANSKGLKELAIESSPNQKIDVIFNGIDSDEFKPLKGKKYSKKLKILTVGRLIERKGYKYLIDALKDLDNVSVDFMGDGPLLEELKEQAKKLQVEANFLGRIDHEKLGLMLNKYDVFVLPSFNEGMSNTVLEAISSGLPLIVTNTGGTKELVKGNGFIVKMRSSSDIRKAVIKYQKDKDLLKKHSKKSREIALTFNWKNVAKEYYELYLKSKKK